MISTRTGGNRLGRSVHILGDIAMRWEGGRESDNVEDRRGMKPAVAAGGGILTLIIIAGAYFLGVDPNKAKQIAQQLDKGGGGGLVKDGNAQLDPKPLKFARTIIGYTEDVWDDQFKQMGKTYKKPGAVIFDSEVVETGGCGTAPNAAGPFYCPADQKVYYDPGFFQVLETQLGGSKAEFSQAYVIAHEVGHHVQNLLGYNARVREYERREGKNATIRLELQADYLAGVWAHHVQKKHNILDRSDLNEAIKTAQSIGDDRIQSKSGRGWVSPESFTHGTSQQRIKWFTEGFKSGDSSQRALDRFFDPGTDPLKL
jgi:predicted metalloprotease